MRSLRSPCSTAVLERPALEPNHVQGRYSYTSLRCRLHLLSLSIDYEICSHGIYDQY
jgi:hypothetical protein